MLRRLLLPAILSASVLAALPACPWAGSDSGAPAPGATSSSPAAAPARRPDVVLVLTDDQRWDSLDVMPAVGHELTAKGITFTNAVVVNPVCCPSRTSILTGQYSHTTGVYTNASGHGGFDGFDATSTIATSLHDGGYRTGLIGKYINGYDPGKHPIPPGWDRWFAYSGDGGAYYDWTAADQDDLATFGDEEGDYSTDVFATEADEFIRSTPSSTPLFLYFAPRAPHGPATPPVRYATAFSSVPPYRPPSYDEADVSDKPEYVRRSPPIEESPDDLRLDQYRALLAVDDAVAKIVTALSETGRLGTALIVFTSDNGLLWGEHRLSSKNAPYEESIRVPLVLRYDPLLSRSRSDRHLVANVDLAPTFADATGVTLSGMEGMSLLPLLRSPDAAWRQDILIEHLESRDDIPTFCAVRSATFKYVAYQTGEQELYDLSKDPFELENLAEESAFAATATEVRDRLRTLCTPPPPGLKLP